MNFLTPITGLFIKHLLNVKHQKETYIEHRQVSITINCHYMDTYFTA